MTVHFIRHGATAGNLERRYIGRTDEPLCEAGISALRTLHPPAAAMIFASPMRRCIETANVLYPGQDILVCDALRETDFGDFEGKTYAELNGNPAYQAWVDSGGNADFPGGESLAKFKSRCISAFLDLMRNSTENVVFIVHGGTIMAICEALHGGDYYAYHIPNGGMLRAEWNGTRLFSLEKL